MCKENCVRTRFAPSPTGFMHVGNLRTALYACLLAHSSKGKFVLRIEDTDQARYVDGAVDVIYATLKAANLIHDEGPDVGGDYGPYIQSERKSLYKEYALELVKKGGAYYCFCEKSEEETEGAGNADPADDPCRAIAPEEAEKLAASGKSYVIRQKIDRTGVTTFSDSVFGDITIENKVLDDQILLKSDGMPTYNFANVIDDHLMAITHVVRGSEYLSSTPKYNLLYQAFGWDIPTYVHLPLIMGRNADGEVAKLSKRHGSVSFENLIADGYLAEAIVNYIALLGWSSKSDREIFSFSELEERFSLSGLNKSPAVFDYDKLKWMNAEYIRQLSVEEFASRAKSYAKIEGTILEENWLKLASLLQQRTELLTEIPEKIAFLLEQPEYTIDMFNNKKSKCTPETAKDILLEMREKFAAMESADAEKITALLTACAEARGVKLGQPMWAVRIALSGTPVTPGGPGEIMELLGMTESMRRIDNALAKL
ncbi:MAG: glutamate--tRNA ligase [Lentisphaeria bacterium]|nr:glutamate--tRNA ligase [Lentisphaeria bacterium]